MRGTGPDWLDPDEGYSFLVLAAYEARIASRRYWARDGPADLKYPAQPMPGWPAAGTNPRDFDTELADRRRRRRE